MNSLSDKLVSSVIFSKTIDQKLFKQIDFEDLVKKLDSKLLIPLFHHKINYKKLNEKFPLDFLEFTREVFEINRERNKKLIKETQYLAKLLNDAKINYAFLKGSAMLIGNYYHDIGVRMIGDIDFLVDNTKIEETKELLCNNGYITPFKNFFQTRHIPRMVKSDKLFAVEAHYKIYDNSCFDLEKKILKEFTKKNNIKIPNKRDLLITNILNHQYNDFGYNYYHISYRNLYDTLTLMGRDNIQIIKGKKNKKIYAYFYIINKKGLFDFEVQLKNKNFLTKIKIDFIYSHRIIYYFNIFLQKLILKVSLFPKQLILFIKSDRYKQHIVAKVKNLL